MDAWTGADSSAARHRLRWRAEPGWRWPVALPRYALAQWIAFTDRRINFTYPAFESALKAAGAPYQVFVHPGTQHGFHNDSTPRENDAAAKPSWTRTVAHFKKRLV